MRHLVRRGRVQRRAVMLLRAWRRLDPTVSVGVCVTGDDGGVVDWEIDFKWHFHILA